MLGCDLLLLQIGTGSSMCYISQYVCRCAESRERESVLHGSAGRQTALGQMVSVLNMGSGHIMWCWQIHLLSLRSVQAWIQTISDSRPYMRGSDSQDLTRIWLQEKLDPTARAQQDWKTGNCTQQVLCALRHHFCCLQIFQIPVCEFRSYILLCCYKFKGFWLEWKKKTWLVLISYFIKTIVKIVILWNIIKI